MDNIFDFDTALESMAWHTGTYIDAKGKNKIKKNKKKNLIVERIELSRNIETALRRYKINGCTDTMNERVILLSFLYRASCLFFKENGVVYAQPANPLGGFNMNDDPVAAYVCSRNGIINKQVNLFIKGADQSHLVEKNPAGLVAKDQTGVLVWENKTRMPFIYTTVYYSNAIADTLRTIDTARLWIKRPFIPVCEESLIPSVMKMTEDLRDNDDLIIMSTGALDIQKFNAIPIDGSGTGLNTAKELVEWYKQQYREACAMRSNTQSDKKGENLLTEEITFNDTFTDTAEDDIIEYMNEQFKFVNEVLGTNLSVEAREIPDVVDTPEIKNTKEEKNEDVSGADR